MEIFIERTNKTLTKSFTGSAKALLDELGVQAEDILLVRNGKLVTEDEELIDEDSIKLLSVVSGG